MEQQKDKSKLKLCLPRSAARCWSWTAHVSRQQLAASKSSYHIKEMRINGEGYIEERDFRLKIGLRRKLRSVI